MVQFAENAAQQAEDLGCTHHKVDDAVMVLSVAELQLHQERESRELAV